MGIQSYNPYTPSRRYATTSTFEEITKDKPERSLTAPRKQKAGRDSAGRISIRHRGGGAKRRYRIVDYRRERLDAVAEVIAVEYDPNRTARLALLKYEDGEKRDILCPEGLRPGAKVVASETAEPALGNCLPLAKIPLGTAVHNVELVPGRGARVVRTAGSGAQVMSRDGGYVTLRMPSGEERKFLAGCRATVGVVGNGEAEGVMLGKAGRKRWLGVRPTVRGVVMNPVDHPMGGGEGRSSGGGPAVSPWGKLAKGGKTRKPRKASDRVILKRRK